MKQCDSKRLTETGTEYCEKRGGHKGWHSYTIQWDRKGKPSIKVIWKK